MTYTVLVRDVNGNTLGRLEFEWGMTIVVPPQAKLSDYGNTVIVTLEGDIPFDDPSVWTEPDPRDAAEPHSVLDHPEYDDPLDRAEAEENDVRIGSLEDRGFPYAGGYGG